MGTGTCFHGVMSHFLRYFGGSRYEHSKVLRQLLCGNLFQKEIQLACESSWTPRSIMIPPSPCLACPAIPKRGFGRCLAPAIAAASPGPSRWTSDPAEVEEPDLIILYLESQYVPRKMGTGTCFHGVMSHFLRYFGRSR